jgi:A/G-specific adenine glycosylase
VNEDQRDVKEFPEETKITWFQDKLISWGKKHLRDFPWRKTKNPYEIFVAELLLQRTDAPRVIPVFLELLKRYPTLATLAEASIAEMAEIL